MSLDLWEGISLYMSISYEYAKGLQSHTIIQTIFTLYTKWVIEFAQEKNELSNPTFDKYLDNNFHSYWRFPCFRCPQNFVTHITQVCWTLAWIGQMLTGPSCTMKQTTTGKYIRTWEQQLSLPWNVVIQKLAKTFKINLYIVYST